MRRGRRALLAALGFPILALGALTFYKGFILKVGREVVLPISGYDPFDPLAGHYLIYRIDYGVDGLCAGSPDVREAYVCLDPKGFAYEFPADCRTRIRGVCRGSRFVAGIERYYVPESNAHAVETLIRQGAGTIRISITPGGEAQVKELLVNGQPL